MSIFDSTWNDWNGDGMVNWIDAGMESAMIQFQLEEMERDDNEKCEQRINNITELIRDYGKPVLEFDDFREICNANGYYTSDFSQEDLDEIQRRLNRFS